MERNTQVEQLQEKRYKKHKDSLREFQDNMKGNNIRIEGIPEGKEKEQEIEIMFEKIMAKLSKHGQRKKKHASSRSTESQSR